MDKKVLIICGQEIIREKDDGGKRCSYRNYELYKNVFGEQNVYLLMYSKFCLDSVNARNAHILRMPSHKNQIKKAVDIIRGNLFTDVASENKTVEFIEENKINIVIFERSLYGSLINKIKRRGLNCQIWVFVHNLEKNYFANKVKHQNFLFCIPYFLVAKSERETFKYSDYTMTLTLRDVHFIRKEYGKKCDMILPMTFKDTFNENNLIEKKEDLRNHRILFIGTMFPPNYDGIKWFINNVMPELNNCELYIVGKNFEQKRKELERENVKVIGTVKNLENYYYSDSVMVMPIFYGDGMKIKTAEAMMYGKTILASDEALEGYNVENIKGIYRCNTKEEFIRTINLVFMENDYNYRKEVRELFLMKYCFDNQVIECREKWKEI